MPDPTAGAREEQRSGFISLQVGSRTATREEDICDKTYEEASQAGKAPADRRQELRTAGVHHQGKGREGRCGGGRVGFEEA